MAASYKFKAPADPEQVVLVTRYELYKHIRSRRLIGILVIEALVLGLILALPAITGKPYPNDSARFIERFTGFTSLLIVIGAVLFAGDAIVAEFQNRTGYLILPNPVRRSTLFAGKFLAAIIIMFGVVTLYYVVAIIGSAIVTGSITDLVIQSYLLALLYVVAAAGMGFFISAVMKGATGALVFTFAVLFLILPVVTGVVGQVGAKPSWSLTFSAETINDVLNTPYPVDSMSHLRFGGQNLTVYNWVPDVSTGVVVMIIYSVVTIALALFLFKRREMVG
ncbi:MAG TPA: ABC transporter permease [Methanomassiliicoccales archaeon]|nr:ABC transporter permease [Methanomassiliicoccales archaeon]